ncbi:MAG: adenylate kinase [Deferribacteraceae bacterium]|jgi:adenylate kinase|nr:adenylate kinase [Deferribacteraceae bacterium]
MINVLFLGAPGSGKGTQSENIIRDYGVIQISTGDILRKAVKDGSALGKEAKNYMTQGLLVPDSLIVGVMSERLKGGDAKNGFILDGFPRTVVQAEALDEMLEKDLKYRLTHVISLEVPDELIYERITGRRSCPACGRVYHLKFNPPREAGICNFDGEKLICRDDDTEAALSKRLKVFHESTAIIKPLYEKRGIVLSLDGAAEPSDVYSKIKAFLDS